MTQLNRYEERESRDLGNKLLFFLIGGSIGAAVALLFAPKSGGELRGDIADATRRGYGTALDKAKELKEKSTEVVSNVREKASELYITAADKASVAGCKQRSGGRKEKIHGRSGTTFGRCQRGHQADHRRPKILRHHVIGRKNYEVKRSRS